jgi:hypothetical protein
VKLLKCAFAKREIAYLGYVISEQGVATCPKKVKAIAEWPQPSCVKELRSFLWIVGYYRKFVRNFGIISRPLTDLLKKNYVFVWTSVQDQAFQKLLCIETYASDGGVGAVLMQDHHPIAYISKSLGPRMRGLSTYEKEFVVILLAVEQWRSYLQIAESHIYSDQKILSHLNEQRLHTTWQQKLFTKLLGLSYRIIYKKGSENSAVDALSRRPNPASEEKYLLCYVCCET